MKTIIQDPKREEILEFVDTLPFRSEFDVFNVECAIYYFAEHNHGGQSSNLYSILSTSKYHPSPIENFDSAMENDFFAKMIYDELTEKFK